MFRTAIRLLFKYPAGPGYWPRLLLPAVFLTLAPTLLPASQLKTGPPVIDNVPALALVTGLEVTTRPDGDTEIGLHLTERVDHSLFTLKQPDRIVIDLPSTRGQNYLNRQHAVTGLIKSLRSAQHVDGSLRVVLDLGTPVRVNSAWSTVVPDGGQRLTILAHAQKKPVAAITAAKANRPAPEATQTTTVKMDLSAATDTPQFIPLIIGDKQYTQLPITLAANLTGGSIPRQALYEAIKPLLNQDTALKLTAAASMGEMISFTELNRIGLTTAYRSDTPALHIDIPVELSKTANSLVQVTGAVLEAITASEEQLLLNLTGPVEHNIFVLTEPDRIVIDLDNTVGVEFINGRRLANTLVQNVRGGTHDNNRLRVVLDLTGPAWADGLLLGPDQDGQYQLKIVVHHIPLPVTAAAKPEPPPPGPEKKISHDSDRILLQLKYDRAPLGAIDAIEYSGGYMLPLSQLFQVLGFPIDVSAETGMANGWFIRSNRLFILDAAKGRVIIDGEEQPFPTDLVQIRDRDIYVESSMLGRLFPVQFVVDPSALTLALVPDSKLSAAEREELVNQWLTVNGVQPAAAPAPQQQLPLATATELEPVVTDTAAQQSEPDAEEPLPALVPDDDYFAGLTEDDLIVLQPFIDDEPVEDFIEVYQTDDGFLLPLRILFEILHFVIEVNPQAGRAQGWFISEDRHFNLDLAARTVLAGAVQEAIPPGAVHVTETDLYVDASKLSQWLPLSFEVDMTGLTLGMQAREKLPFQIREERLRAWNRMQYRNDDDKDYETIYIPYQMATLPFIDFNLNQAYANSGPNQHITSYALNASGDLGYLSTNIYTYGDSVGHVMDSLRIEGGRQSDTPTLLGPLRATQYTLGDVTSITIPLVAQSSSGRGFSVTNQSMFRASEFDATNFIGDALPDWDVELYRNGALIDSQIVGKDGRYEFLDVPILFGNNTFQLIFHGPEGQIREEVKRYNISDAFLKQGEFNYEFSVDDKSQPLFDVGVDKMFNHTRAIRVGGEIEYGLTKSVTGALGMLSTPLQDGEHRYLTGGIRTGLGGFLGSLDTAWDQSNNGWAARLATYGQIRDINVKAEYSRFDNFVSEMALDTSQRLASRAELGFNGIFSLPRIDDFNFNVDVNRDEFESGLTRWTIKSLLAKSLLGMRFTNNAEHVISDTGDFSHGELSLRGTYRNALLRATLGYTLSPELQANQLMISAQKRIFDDVTAIAVVTQSLTDGWLTSLAGSLNWDRDLYRFSLAADIDSNLNFNVGGNIIFSLGRLSQLGEWVMQGQSLAGRGGVLPRAFLDRNLNSQFDEDDEVIDKARFKVQMNRVSTDNGIAMALGLPPNRYTNVEIDATGLEDPLWMPAVEGYKVIPRPGIVAPVDFPVVETSEIDGVVYFIDNEGQEKPVPRIGVELIDAASGETVKQFRSEFDGYFLIDKVRPGNYYLRVSEKDLSRLDLFQIEEPQLLISGESNIYNGYDIKLRKDSGTVIGFTEPDSTSD